MQSSVQKHATLEGPKRPCSLSEGVIKSGGELFATEGLRGFKAFRLQSGRAWLFQKLQLSQRKALCNLHQEVCAEGRRRGQGEVAALRRGQSKLLSRKKKAKPKHPTPQRSPLLSASARARPASGFSSQETQPRASLRLKVQANCVSTPRDAQPMGPLDRPRPGRAQCVKLPCFSVGGGTLTYICPMGEGTEGGTVTQFEPMRQAEGGSTWLYACCLTRRVGVEGKRSHLKEPQIQKTVLGNRKLLNPSSGV